MLLKSDNILPVVMETVIKRSCSTGAFVLHMMANVEQQGGRKRRKFGKVDSSLPNPHRHLHMKHAEVLIIINNNDNKTSGLRTLGDLCTGLCK